MNLFIPVMTAGLLALPPADAAPQRQGDALKTVPVTLNLTIGPDTLQGAGPGRCTHAPVASIYDIRAQMWTAAFESQGRPVRLTFWRPTDKSPEMFGLQAPRVNISTVRGGKPNGSGTATFEPAGKGGTFKIQAKTANGTVVAGSIKCDGFLPHVAEGG
jgi:hypothetical protein